MNVERRGMTHAPTRILMITSEWPEPGHPYRAPYVVRQVDFLRRAGFEIDVFSFRGAKNPINYLRAWFNVQRRIRRGEYDVIHAQWGQSAPPALPTRVPLVVTFRGGEGEGIVSGNGRYTFSGWILRMVSAFVARRADELIVVSARMRRYLPARRTHVIPSGLDFSRLPLMPRDEARRQLGLPAAKRLVLFVGSPDDGVKRYPLAQEVVARLGADLDAEMVVAWGQPHDKIPVYMNACDALLLVSMYEGSPNVVKEALACNLPVVSVDVGDVRERLADVAGCTVCDDDSPDRLAAALAAVLRAGTRVDGRTAVRELDEQILTQRLIDVYRLATERHKAETVPPSVEDALGKARTGART